MKLIKLTQGKFAKVDDDDFEWLNQWKWYLNKGYAGRNIYNGKVKKDGAEKMHRVIMKPPEGMQVDHINRDKLDNRRENLRICTDQQNRWNRGQDKGNPSKYKGVYRRGNKWRCIICVYGKLIHLGSYDNPEEAARIYDEAVIKIRGEFAYLNFPEEVRK